MTTRFDTPQQLFWIVAGFGAWGAALVSLYSIHGLGCAFAWQGASVQLSLALVLLAHLAVIGWMWRHVGQAARPSDAGATGYFLHVVAVWSVIAAFATTLLTLGPPLLLTGCTLITKMP